MGEECLCSTCLLRDNGCSTSSPFCTECTRYEANDGHDHVKYPIHYTQGGIECIQAIEASMSPPGFQDYCKGNVLKYIWRWRDKNGIEDLEKAEVYLKWMIESAKKMVGGTE